MPFDDENDQDLEESTGRPLSIGQRIAGARDAAAAGGGSTADTTPTDVYPKFDPKLIPDTGLGTVKPEQIPPPPSSTQNSAMVDLTRRQAELEKPINPMDPQTGKIKPQYRMGTGQRILGTLTNFASGFSKNPGTPIYVGPGATNWRFGREENQRQKELAGVNEQLGTQETLAKENEKMFSDTERGLYQGQVGEARMGTSKAQQETADVKQQLEASQAALNAAKANKQNQPKEPTNEVEAAAALEDAKAKNDKAGIAKWTAVLNELARQKKAGKDTSGTDMAKAIQVAEYRGREHDRVNQAEETERTKRYAELDKDFRLKYNPQAMAAAKQKVDSDLTTKYQPQHQNVDDEADKMLSITKSGAPLKSNAGGGPAKTQPRKPPKTGEIIQVKQKDGTTKPGRVTGINPKTNKPIVDYNVGQ